MKKKGVIAAVILGVTALVTIIVGDFLFSRNFTENFMAMNTVISVDVTGIDSKQTLEKIKAEILRLDTDLLSRTQTSSEVFAVNSGKTEVSKELGSILTQLKKLEQSTPAFRSGLGALSDLWGINTESPKVPSESELSEILINKCSWELSGNRVTLAQGTVLDLGATGKGIACDYAKELLTASECRQAVVAVGGSVLLWSANEKEEFTVGIRNPLGSANEHAATLRLNSCCVSTSGSYERYFESESGERYHHIFNPQTGYPAQSGLLSVTVISDSGLLSDALSTACFVLGLENSLPLLEEYSAQAVFITQDCRIIATDGIAGRLTVTDSNFTQGEF